jgi:hypothetical protein
MKIIITRSFSRTKQAAAFEPINSFCSAQSEVEVDGVAEALEMAMNLSEELDILCRSEVEKTIVREIAKRKPIDKPKIQDTVKVETQLDSGAEAKAGYKEI